MSHRLNLQVIEIEFINGILFIKPIQNKNDKHTFMQNSLIVKKYLNGIQLIIIMLQSFIFGLDLIHSKKVG